MKKIVILSVLLSAIFAQNAFSVMPQTVPGPNEPPQPQIPTDGNYVVAVLDGKNLTLAEVNYFTPATDLETVKNVANFWINTQLLYDEAVKKAVDKDAKTKFMADNAFKKTIASAYIEQVQKEIKVSDADVKKYYEENKEKDPRLMEPAYLSFSHITVDTNEQAVAIRQRLEQGEEINELAKTLSVASDAKKGGKAVKFREETVQQRYGQAFFDALKMASEGQIIGPVKNTEGKYEIARHEGSRASKVLEYDKVKDQIKASLESRQKKESIEKLINDLREKEKSRYKLQGMFEEKENKNADEKKSEK